MTTLAIKGNPLGLGNMTLVSPNSSLSQTLTLPDSTGNVVVDVSTQTLTNKTLGSGTVTATSLITSGTAQASTSGVAIDFTGIPSWVKRITVMFNGVSTNGTAQLLLQLGAGVIDTSGYLGGAGSIATSTASASAGGTAGFLVGWASAPAATTVRHGAATLSNFGSNIWVCAGTFNFSDSAVASTVSGTKSLGGALDRVRITTVAGTDTFDAGSINILYE